MGQRAKLVVAAVVLLGLAVAGIALLRNRGGGDGRPAVGAAEPPAAIGDGPRGVAAPALAGNDANAPATLGGTVRDALSGEAVGGVEVRFSGTAEVTATSGDDGRFEVELAGGSYRVSVATEALVSMRALDLLVAPGARLAHLDVRVVATARVDGRVVDGDGEPLGAVELGCEATLAGEPVGPGGALAPCVGATAEDGAFSLAIPPGRVELTASLSGRPSASMLLRWVEPGARLRGVELVLDHPGRVAGTLVDGSGAAVAEGQVTAWREGALVGRATAADGAFSIDALPAGTIELRAIAPGFGQSEPRAVELVAGGEQTVTLVMTAPQRVRGRVSDGAGAAVAGARVQLRYPGREAVVAETTAGADGAYELAAVGRGPYDAHADKEGFAPALRAGVGAPNDDVALVLSRAGGIDGTVTANGAPLTDFTVRLTNHVPLDGTAPAPYAPGLRFAAPDGGYRIDGVLPGRYDVVVSAPDFAPKTLAGVIVVPGEHARADAALVGGATVAGAVVDVEHHRPIFGVLVALSTGHEGELAYTDAGGRYRVDDVAPGRRSVSFSHPGYVGRIESAIELATGDRRVVDVELQPRDSSAVDDGAAGEPIEFAGIGAALQWRKDRLWVQGVVPHGPAEVAGLEPEDEIVEIDGLATKGRGLGASIEDIRGVAGTAVRLKVGRVGVEPFELEIVRATVRYAGGE